jgi:VWFA-related protein
MGARLACCLLILGVPGARLQLSAQSGKPDIPQRFRSLRFVAIGANGQPVKDLRPEEVQVSDEGHSYPLALLRLLPSAPEAADLKPGEYWNRGRGRMFSSTLILLDLLNANASERASDWDEAVQTLKGQALRKPDAAATTFLYLLAPDATAYPAHTWPGQGTAWGEPTPPWTSRARELLDQALGIVRPRSIRPVATNGPSGFSAELTYQALSGLAEQYAMLPGQKRIVWVTPGIPMTTLSPDGNLPVDLHRELSQTAEYLVNRGVALYTVRRERAGARINSEAIRTLPILTGGRGFERDAVGPALAQASIDADASYRGGYFIPYTEANGKPHRIRISVARKGVSILAPREYTPYPNDGIWWGDEAQTRLFDTPDIAMRVSTQPGPKATRFQIRLDPRDLLLQRAEHGYLAKYFLIYVFTGPTLHTHTIPAYTAVSLTQQQLDAAIKDGYSFTAEQPIPDGTQEVRVVVQDANTGFAGSVTIPAALP